MTAAVVAAFVVGYASGRRAASRSRAPLSAPLVTVVDVPISTSGRASEAIVPPPLAAESAGSKSAALAQRVARMAGSIAAEEERQKLIEEWAAIDPRAALEFARTQLQGDRQAQALSAAIAVWGRHDPAAAWAWVGAEMPTATHQVDNLLEVFGRQSAELARGYAARYALTHPEAALEVNLAALLGVTHRGDFAGAREFVDRQAALDPVLRANLNNFIAGQWARFAPQEAAAWVMQLPAGPEREQAMVGLGESWSDVDPAAAAAFATTLPAGESRSLAMRQSVAKWVQQDPIAAREWVVQSNQYEDFDTAVEAIATQNNFMSREPAHAMVWATGIFDDALRAKTMSVVLHNWHAIDRPSALAYLQSSTEFSPAQRAELLQTLAPSG